MICISGWWVCAFRWKMNTGASSTNKITHQQTRPPPLFSSSSTSLMQYISIKIPLMGSCSINAAQCSYILYSQIDIKRYLNHITYKKSCLFSITCWRRDDLLFHRDKNAKLNSPSEIHLLCQRGPSIFWSVLCRWRYEIVFSFSLLFFFSLLIARSVVLYKHRISTLFFLHTYSIGEEFLILSPLLVIIELGLYITTITES